MEKEKIQISEMIVPLDKMSLFACAVTAALSIDSSYEKLGIIPGLTTELTLEFSINGVPASLRAFMGHLDIEMKRLIEERAIALVKDRMSGAAVESIDDMASMVKTFEREMLQKLFPDRDHWEER